MFRIRLLLVALSLSLLAGCASSQCCGHPWLGGLFNRRCCQPSCCETPSCCDSCGTVGSSGYGTTIMGSSVVQSPAVVNSPTVVVPAPSGALATPPAAVPQHPMAKPMPYVPNGK
jgi:hypothetical protein